MQSSGARSPYLLLAHHRSGSNFLNDVLQSHPHIECINEPLSMHTRYFRECDLVPWSRSDFDRDLLHRSLAPFDELRSYLVDFKAYLQQSNRMKVIGFKETVLFGKLEWLKEFVPSLKIILLKRDARAIISSVLRSDLVDLWNYAGLVPPAFRRVCPGYTARRTDHPRDVAAAELAAMSVVTRYGLAHRALDLFEHHVLQLDELTREPERCLQLMTGFLGVDPHPEQLTFLRERQTASRGGLFSSFRAQEDVENAWKQHLTPAQIEVIEDVLAAAQAKPGVET